MADPTFEESGGTTLTFRPGNLQATRVPTAPRQRRVESVDRGVFTTEVAAKDTQRIIIEIVQLPEADEGSYSGYSSLRTFIRSTVNYAASKFVFTDTDGDAWTVRFWDPRLELEEVQKGVWEGRMTLWVHAFEAAFDNQLVYPTLGFGDGLFRLTSTDFNYRFNVSGGRFTLDDATGDVGQVSGGRFTLDDGA